MQDYPVDEDAVHRGDDDRIAPAVESAVAMGFLREDATQAAKRVITEFPGRQNVEELVVDALLRNAHGGARAFALPKTMPTKYADNALLRETKGLAASENENEATLNSGDGAIDLTESPEAKPPKKRKTHEREAVDTNEGNANKTPVIALEDAETDQTKPSETDQTKRVSATLGGNGNDLMRQLAAERRARDTARGGAEREPGKFAATPRSTNREPSLFGGGASGSGAGGSGSGLTGAAARAALGAAASRGAGNVAFGGSGAIDSVLANDTGVDTSEPLPFIKVLTYNVWFAEHVALADRVQGLSDVVRESDPHVLCLQEVTPNTLMLLHAQSWFETYKCTPPPTQPYFTLVLFKRHLQAANKTTRLVRRVFPNSVRIGPFPNPGTLFTAPGRVHYS
jgi:tyrosyl-DNA phosphodiesterase 2|tara:strand:+ start:919 stop:2109 length:1191 start_codon:yes stop_codon:yes gene_type:complete